MDKVAELLVKIQGQRIYFDANLLIYFFDKTEPYIKVVAPIILACDQNQVFGCTGDAAVAELMVYPYRSRNQIEIARGKAFFMRDNFLQVLPHDSGVFDTAARLRAETNMKLIDALHFATALKAGCKYFITNDTGIRSSDTLEVILIKDCFVH